MASRTSTAKGTNPRHDAPARSMAAGRSDAAIIELPGLIGAQVADLMAIVQNVMVDVRNERRITRTQVTSLEATLKVASRIAMRSQQLARLAAGRLRQSHERLALHAIVQEVMDGMAAQFKADGVEASHRLSPVEVIVDPGHLISLVQIAMEWAAARGGRLDVRLDIRDVPAHADFTLRSSAPAARAGAGQRAADDLDWHLLMQIAQAMGVILDRAVAADHTLLSIQFPRTVRELEGLTAVEMHDGDDSTAFMTEAKPFAGHHVLVIATDSGTVDELRAVCKNMALVMDLCSSSAGAARVCEVDRPHVIVVAEELRDAAFEELRDALKRGDMKFPVLEVTRRPNVLEMSDWMGDDASRISRESLQSHLPSFLVMELAKAS